MEEEDKWRKREVEGEEKNREVRRNRFWDIKQHSLMAGGPLFLILKV